MFRKKRINRQRFSNNRTFKKGNVANEKWHEKHGTTSDWATVLTGVIVGGFTIALFFQTQRSTEAAITAVEETRKAVAESKRANDIAKKNYELTEAAIKKQEQTFNIENTPFLRMDVTEIMPIIAEQPPTLKILNKNLGKYPARVIQDEFSLIYSKTFKKIMPFQFKNQMVYDLVENHPIEIEAHGKPISASQLDSLTTGKYFIYYFGRITYVNEANGNRRRYEYAAKITYKPLGLEWIYNRNYNIK